MSPSFDGYGVSDRAPGSRHTTAEDGTNLADAVKEHLRRILSSRSFANSIRLSRFLDYIVSKSLSGQRDDIREYNIGVDVFDRGESFDPRVDSVVRVEARRLRRMLSEYYRNEGSLDGIRIEVPTGSYVPSISRAEHAGGVDSPPGEDETAPASIAVLPFTDLSPERDQEHFCDGMSEQLIDLLTAVDGIKTVSRTSCFAFKGRRQDVREIGEKLGVQWIVEGSVRKSGETLRVSVRLSRCENGFQLWACSYDRTAFDVFEIQDEIGRAVLAALKGCVRNGAAPRQAVRTCSLEAYDHFLRGRFHYAKQNRPGLQKAIDSFKKAIAADPGYAPAHVALSRCFRQSALYGLLPSSEAMPKARAAAMQALALDPANGEAHAALAGVLSAFDLDWDAAGAKYADALRCPPVSNLTRHSYVLFYLIPKRRFEEALEQLALVTESDPLSPLNGVARSWTHFFTGRFQDAIEHANSVLETNETNVMGQLALGWALGEADRASEAVAVLEQAMAVAGGGSIILGSLGFAYGRAGRAAEARRVLKTASLRPFDAALVHIALGNSEKALESLEEAVQERCPRQVWIGVDPRFSSLRGDARFTNLLHRLGLPQPARARAAASAAISQGRPSAHSVLRAPLADHRRKRHTLP